MLRICVIAIIFVLFSGCGTIILRAPETEIRQELHNEAVELNSLYLIRPDYIALMVLSSDKHDRIKFFFDHALLLNDMVLMKKSKFLYLMDQLGIDMEQELEQDPDFDFRIE